MTIRWDYVGAATGIAGLLWQISKHIIDTRERLRLAISNVQVNGKDITLNVDATNTSPTRRLELRPYIWIATRRGAKQASELPDSPVSFWHPKRRWAWDCLPADGIDREPEDELSDLPIEPRSSIGLMARVEGLDLRGVVDVGVEDTLGRLHTAGRSQLSDWRRRIARLRSRAEMEADGVRRI